MPSWLGGFLGHLTGRENEPTLSSFSALLVGRVLGTTGPAIDLGWSCVFQCPLGWAGSWDWTLLCLLPGSTSFQCPLGWAGSWDGCCSDESISTVNVSVPSWLGGFLGHLDLIAP